MCQNKELKYDFNGKSYYFYAQGYKGAKNTPNFEIDTTTYLTSTCKEDKYYKHPDFKTSSRHQCDSIHTLYIHLNRTPVTTVDTSICISQTYNFLGKDTVFKTTGTHVLSNTIQTECGCDNGVTHTVHVYPVYNNPEVADTICQWLKDGDEKYYKWTNHPKDGEPNRKIYMLDTRNNKGRHVWANKIPLDTLAGTYQLIDSLRTKACTDCNQGHGCDSIHTKLLTIIPTYDYTIEKLLSDKSTFEWDGTLFVGPKATEPSGTTLEIIKPAVGKAECQKKCIPSSGPQVLHVTSSSVAGNSAPSQPRSLND